MWPELINRLGSRPWGTLGAVFRRSRHLPVTPSRHALLSAACASMLTSSPRTSASGPWDQKRFDCLEFARKQYLGVHASASARMSVCPGGRSAGASRIGRWSASSHRACLRAVRTDARLGAAGGVRRMFGVRDQMPSRRSARPSWSGSSTPTLVTTACHDAELGFRVDVPGIEVHRSHRLDVGRASWVPSHAPACGRCSISRLCAEENDRAILGRRPSARFDRHPAFPVLSRRAGHLFGDRERRLLRELLAIRVTRIAPIGSVLETDFFAVARACTAPASRPAISGDDPGRR